jgi:hypothetical protein
LEITGTTGTYVFGGNDHTIYRHADGEAITIKKNNRPGETHKYYENVRDHLVKGRPLTITGEWSRRPIHILDQAGRSARDGRALTVKYA